MKKLRSWAILGAVVGAIGLTVYAAAQNGVASPATNSTEVNTGCVPYPATNRGHVIINYVDRDGNPIESYVSLTQDVGSTYDTTPYRKDKITVNGSDYYLMTDRLPSNETGTVQSNTTNVTYTLDVKRGYVVFTFGTSFANVELRDKSISVSYTLAEDLPVGSQYTLPVTITAEKLYSKSSEWVGRSFMEVFINGQSILDIGTTPTGENPRTLVENYLTNYSIDAEGYPDLSKLENNRTITIQEGENSFYVGYSHVTLPE